MSARLGGGCRGSGRPARAAAPWRRPGLRRRARLRRLARDADPQVALLDLDLGQVGVVEDAREVADQLLINTGLLCRHDRVVFLLLLMAASKPGGERLERQRIAERPEAADHADRHRRDHGMVAERLAGVDVGKMHFDDRQRRDRRGSRRGWRSRCGYRRRD